MCKFSDLFHFGLNYRLHFNSLINDIQNCINDSCILIKGMISPAAPNSLVGIGFDDIGLELNSHK